MAGWLKEYGYPDPPEMRHFMMSSDFDGDLPGMSADAPACGMGSDLTVIDETAHEETAENV